MKTTLDLPERLVREMKIRAATEGRKLRDVAADIIEKGLAAPVAATENKEHRVKLPFFEGTSSPKSEELTPDKIHEILLNQEIEWHHEVAGR
jgi:hypothetical protein